MKRIDRYLIGVFSLSWSISLVFFLGMYFVIHFFSRMKGLTDSVEAFQEAGLGATRGFLVYYLVNAPFILVEVLPFSVLMAGMWTLQYMARRNELVPVVTSGVSFKRLCVPMLIMGFALSLVFTVVREEALPDLADKRQRMERLVRGDQELVLEDLMPVPDGKGYLFHMAEYYVHRRMARTVSVLDAEEPGARLATAEAVVFRPDGPRGSGWYPLQDARVTGRVELFQETDLTPRDIRSESSTALYMSVSDLDRMLERHPERLHLRVLKHAGYAYPLSTLILLLMGLPLVLRGHRRSPYVAAGLSLLLSVTFYAVQNVLQDMGARGDLPDPLVAAWLPQLVFGSAALVLFETMPT